MVAPGKLTARYAGSGGLLVLGAFAVAACSAWAVTQLATLTGAAGHLPIVWLVSLALLWWLPLSWMERPIKVPPDARERIDALRVTVQIPVYNEDPEALRACLRSVLTQSRPVNRVRVVDDGSAFAGEPVRYDDVRRDFECEAMLRGIETTWDRTGNRGKRFAQMHVLAEDDGDVFLTLDSDSVLDRHAVREGLAPFADPRVRSVAGHVLVLNRTAGLLTRLTGVLYLPFTSGLRSAQSVLRRVTMNSGALAFYRADVVRACAGAYENERFRGRPTQMNDDSMLTFYASLSGHTVHQPSSMVFTLAPERLGHYAKQQLRWMRGTAVRHLWWLRYQPLTGPVFWTTVAEYLHLLLALAVPVVLVADPAYRGRLGELALAAAQAGAAMNYLMALRLFTVRRSDESAGARLLAFALAPLASVWRSLVLRPMYVYALLTCRRVNRWGTRGSVEVSLGAAA
ncbi:hyaluronan synthase HasA [Nonomuraea maheshkhaliensis]|uniref:Hyaluronan synthase HasA n=1 Tax=Nonomuraea maheshkhaliensis TaxID=419590 RepID=A0ABN2G2S8_9ACTN